MPMYHYNLLPIAAQKRIRHWLIIQQLQIGLAIITLLLIAFSIVLWNANRGLSTLIAAADEQAAQSIQLRSARVVPYDIDAVNQEITSIQTIQSQHINIIALMQSISAAFPAGVTASRITVDVTSQKLTFTGTAKTRAAFQSFQDSIQSTPGFSVLSFPYDALTQPANIDFQIVVRFTPNHFFYE